MTRVWGIIFLKERCPVGYSVPNDQNIYTMKKYTYKKHYMANQAVLIHKEMCTYVCKHICICVYITTIREKKDMNWRNMRWRVPGKL